MLPYSNDFPTQTDEVRCCLKIPFAVLVDLCHPPVSIGRGPGGVDGAAMPEAAINKNCNLHTGEGNVHASSSKARYPKANAIPIASAVENLSKGQFWLCMLSSLPFHPLGHCGGAGDGRRRHRPMLGAWGASPRTVVSELHRYKGPAGAAQFGTVASSRCQ